MKCKRFEVIRLCIDFQPINHWADLEDLGRMYAIFSWIANMTPPYTPKSFGYEFYSSGMLFSVFCGSSNGKAVTTVSYSWLQTAFHLLLVLCTFV